MKRPTRQQLDAYLDRVVRRARHIRQLNLSTEGCLHQALEESQSLLASIAMYRHLLKRMDEQEKLAALS